jgi:hypothetical protein
MSILGTLFGGGTAAAGQAAAGANLQATGNQVAGLQQSAEAGILSGEQPYTQLGQSGAGTLQSLIPSLSSSFTAQDLTNNLAPNYQFGLQQGQGQTAAMLNSSGGALSGNFGQGLNTFTQNYAQNAYQNAFNNYQTNQNNIYTRLAGIAGLGQTGQTQVNTGATTTAANAGNALIAGAGGAAAGLTGATGTIGNALTSAGNMYGLSQLGSTGGGAIGAATSGMDAGTAGGLDSILSPLLDAIPFI